MPSSLRSLLSSGRLYHLSVFWLTLYADCLIWLICVHNSSGITTGNWWQFLAVYCRTVIHGSTAHVFYLQIASRYITIYYSCRSGTFGLYYFHSFYIFKSLCDYKLVSHEPLICGSLSQYKHTSGCSKLCDTTCIGLFSPQYKILASHF